MAQWKAGEKVWVVTRKVTAEDKTKNRYFEHMAGAEDPGGALVVRVAPGECPRSRFPRRLETLTPP